MFHVFIFILDEIITGATEWRGKKNVETLKLINLGYAPQTESEK